MVVPAVPVPMFELVEEGVLPAPAPGWVEAAPAVPVLVLVLVDGVVPMSGEVCAGSDRPGVVPVSA